MRNGHYFSTIPENAISDTKDSELACHHFSKKASYNQTYTLERKSRYNACLVLKMQIHLLRSIYMTDQ